LYAKEGVCLTACVLHKPLFQSIFDNYILTIANLGDCELGILSKYENILNGKMLSQPHNTRNIQEREYLIKEFPNDTNILFSRNNT